MVKIKNKSGLINQYSFFTSITPYDYFFSIIGKYGQIKTV